MFSADSTSPSLSASPAAPKSPALVGLPSDPVEADAIPSVAPVTQLAAPLAQNDDDATAVPAAYFSRSFDVRWADVDPNRHLRHSAFADYATHVRLQYLEDQGWAMSRFSSEGIGPVILREETRYKREVELGDVISVDFRVGHMSKCGRKWTVIQHITRRDGELCAVCTLDGIWLDLAKRRPLRPPADLHLAMTRIVDESLAVKRRR